MEQTDTGSIQVRLKARLFEDGYTMLPNKVIRSKKLDVYDRLVYADLLSYAWGQHSCYPTQERIAMDLSISDNIVRRACNNLIEVGLIIREKAEGGRNYIYYIDFDTDMGEGAPSKPEPPTDPKPKPKAERKKKEPLPPVTDPQNCQEFIRYFCQNYKETYDLAYPVSGGRDGSEFGRLLESYSPERLKELIDLAFQHRAQFESAQYPTLSIMYLKYAFNRLARFAVSPNSNTEEDAERDRRQREKLSRLFAD